MNSAGAAHHARLFLHKAEEYLASAQDNVDLEGATPGAGDAIHAGICAKDAIVMMTTGTTGKAKMHAKAASELRRALGTHPEAATAEKALRELIAMKGDVEYGTSLIPLAKVEPLLRRAHSLVTLARVIVRS